MEGGPGDGEREMSDAKDSKDPLANHVSCNFEDHEEYDHEFENELQKGDEISLELVRHICRMGAEGIAGALVEYAGRKWSITVNEIQQGSHNIKI